LIGEDERATSEIDSLGSDVLGRTECQVVRRGGKEESPVDNRGEIHRGLNCAGTGKVKQRCKDNEGQQNDDYCARSQFLVKRLLPRLKKPLREKP
jgi:hypothetical protein